MPASASLNPASLSQHIDALRAQLVKAMGEAGVKLRENPDNPRIQRLGGGNAFIVRFSELAKADAGRLDPFFHDWQAQYKYMHKLLDSRSFGAIADVIESGQTRERRDHPARRFAPEVVSRVREIFGDPAVLRNWSQTIGIRSGAADQANQSSQDADDVAIERAEPRQLARRPRP